MRFDKEFIKKNEKALGAAVIVVFVGLFSLKGIISSNGILGSLSSGQQAAAIDALSPPNIDASSTVESDTLPYDENGSFVSDTNWKGVYGIVNPAVDGLELSAAPTTNGATAIFTGTSTWTDYLYVAHVSWNKGSDVQLFARYQDNRDYAACVFDSESMSIRQDLDGTTTNIVTISNPVQYDLPNVALGMLVSGDTVTCYQGSQVATSTSKIDPTLDHGAIGISIWDQKKDDAQTTVKDISVVPLSQSVALIKTLPTYVSLVQGNQAPAPTQTTAQATTNTAPVPQLSLYDVFGDVLPYVFDPHILSGDNSGTDVSAYEGQLSDWKTITGTAYVLNDTLYLNTAPYKTSMQAMLKGAQNWTDYQFDADFTWGIISSISLYARDTGNGDYVTCKYIDRGNDVILTQVNKGKSVLIGTGSNPAIVADQSLLPITSAGIRVEGDMVSCLNDGAVVIQAPVPGLPSSGTVSIGMYGSNPGAASLAIHSIRIAPVTDGQ